MSRALRLAVLGLSLATGSRAAANPVLTGVTRLRQVPGSRHVQVTLAGFTLPETVRLFRDGKERSATWAPLRRFFANGGSGVTEYQAIQCCDCNVSLGPHPYSVHNGSYLYPLASVTVVDARRLPLKPLKKRPAPARRKAPVGDPDLPFDDLRAPGNDLEPTRMQGLDCLKTCTSRSSSVPVARAPAIPPAPRAASTGRPAARPLAPSAGSPRPGLRPRPTGRAWPWWGVSILVLLAAATVIVGIVGRRRG